MIIAGTSITPERDRYSLFSWPCGSCEIELAVSSRNLVDRPSLDELDRRDRRIAMVEGTVAESVLSVRPIKGMHYVPE